ncbi:MAG: hypothetical protein WKF82_02925 [Nocardioidaceae bacterium]
MSAAAAPTPSHPAGEGLTGGGAQAEGFQSRRPAALYCDHCGKALRDIDHGPCAERRRLEPPRYCSVCARRLVVQVVPRGWSARCSAHGAI